MPYTSQLILEHYQRFSSTLGLTYTPEWENNEVQSGSIVFEQSD